MPSRLKHVLLVPGCPPIVGNQIVGYLREFLVSTPGNSILRAGAYSTPIERQRELKALLLLLANTHNPPVFYIIREKRGATGKHSIYRNLLRAHGIAYVGTVHQRRRPPAPQRGALRDMPTTESFNQNRVLYRKPARIGIFR